MRVWGIKNKLGFLIDEDGEDYGTLLDAKLFKLKKGAQTCIKDGKKSVLFPEHLAKIDIKEVK